MRNLIFNKENHSIFNSGFVFLIVFSFLFLETAIAQDLITRKNGVMVNCLITKVDSARILFKVETKSGAITETYLSLDSISGYKYEINRPVIDFMPKWWVNIGIGSGSPTSGSGSDNSSISSGIIYSTLIGKGLLSIRFVGNKEFSFFVSPLESIWDIGVLYGAITRSRYVFASISGGVAFVGGVQRTDILTSLDFQSEYESSSITSVGIPLESQFFWTPSRYFGIGVYAFANVNLEKSFYGCLFCLQFSLPK